MTNTSDRKSWLASRSQRRDHLRKQLGTIARVRSQLQRAAEFDELLTPIVNGLVSPYNDLLEHIQREYT